MPFINKEETGVAAFILAMILVILGVFYWATRPDVQARAASQEAQREIQEEQENINRVLDHITYIHDIRTHQCFAYYLDGSNAAQVAGLATVPCESVPPGLLRERK